MIEYVRGLPVDLRIVGGVVLLVAVLWVYVVWEAFWGPRR
jgi:hypothetical protein